MELVTAVWVTSAVGFAKWAVVLGLMHKARQKAMQRGGADVASDDGAGSDTEPLMADDREMEDLRQRKSELKAKGL
jgi:hypothetical protein